MKRRLGVLFFFGLCSIYSSTFASTLEWDRNIESDMRNYNVYACYVKGCTVSQIPSLIVGTTLQPAVGVKPTFVLPTGKEGNAAVSALDTSSNESPLSNVVPFDSLKPSAPAGLAVK